MSETDAATIVGLLADDDRLRVTAAVALGARNVDAIAERTARYLAVAVPRSEGNVQVRMHAADGRVVDVQDIRVDGAVGG